MPSAIGALADRHLSKLDEYPISALSQKQLHAIEPDAISLMEPQMLKNCLCTQQISVKP